MNLFNWQKNPQIAKMLKIPQKTVEGYLYPDTYKFIPQSPPLKVIKTMVKNFNKKFSQLSLEHSPLNLKKYEIIILASIVEKETGAAHERPLIAGVFINRLKKKMRLQSDPTTIYGIYEQFNGNLRKKTPSPKNTL